MMEKHMCRTCRTCGSDEKCIRYSLWSQEESLGRCGCKYKENIKI